MLDIDLACNALEELFLPKPRSLASGTIAMKFNENTTVSEAPEKMMAIGTNTSSQFNFEEHNVCLKDDAKVKPSSLWP